MPDHEVINSVTPLDQTHHIREHRCVEESSAVRNRLLHVHNTQLHMSHQLTSHTGLLLTVQIK